MRGSRPATKRPELQIGALRGAGCEKIFTEHVSGASRKRPELEAALEYVRAGDTLVVWKLDRLGRTLRQLVLTIEDLATRQIGFRSLTETINTATPMGQLYFHFACALAQFERELGRERTMAGLDAARARGHHPGRPSKLDEKSLREAEAMLRDPAIRVSDIAKRLNISTSTLYRHLPAARTQARINHPNPVSDEDHALLVDYLTNPASWDDPEDTVPAAISETIGHFVLDARESMPATFRSSTAWRDTINAAIPSSRKGDPDRYKTLFAWLWADILPLCQPIADAIGHGPLWTAMLREPVFERCRSTMFAIDGRSPTNHHPVACAMSHIAQATAELLPEPPYTAVTHRLGSGMVADVLEHVVEAMVAANPDTTPETAWQRIDPAALIHRLITTE